MGDDWIGVRPRRLNERAVRGRRTRKEEERVAARLGGRRVPGSGSRQSVVPSYAGSSSEGYDISTPDFAVEHKRTGAKSISVRREWLKKISVRAKRSARHPAVVLTFETNNQQDVRVGDWVLLPLDVFTLLRELAAHE